MKSKFANRGLGTQMRYLIHAGLAVFILFTLSACVSAPSFDEYRSELCPTCTDAQWRVKTAELDREWERISAEQYKQKQKEAQEERQRAKSEAISAFAQKYERCYIRNHRKIETLGVTSPEFLALCKEYVADQAKKNGNSDVAFNGPSNDGIVLRRPVVQTVKTSNKRWDNKGNPRTWLTSQSPLWACLDKHRWVWDTIRGQTRHTDTTSVDEGYCKSDANTKGKTFTIKAEIKRYIPPRKTSDDSFGGILKSINPLKVLTSCKPVNTAGGTIKGLGLINVGLGACKAAVSISKENKDEFIGWTEITLDGKMVHLCEKWKERSFSPTGNAMPCFGKFLADTKQRKTVFEYTGIRPDSVFGPAGSVSILNSCAAKHNWASYGRDATSEEVAFCQTRKRVQDNKAYQIEARQLRVGASEQIKITIGRKKARKLDLNRNTRIRNIVYEYECGNKSFSRMKNDPRGTAVACIQDMLGLMAANRSMLDARAQNIATQLEALGGYGWTRAEEQKALTGG